MRKFCLCILVLSLCFCSVSFSESPTEEQSTPSYETGDVILPGMSYPAPGEYTAYAGDCIPDEETAYMVAKAIYDVCIGDGREIRAIKYDDIYDAWYISFRWDKECETPMLGGGYSMYLRKSDGQVLSIFMNE